MRKTALLFLAVILWALPVFAQYSVTEKGSSVKAYTVNGNNTTFPVFITVEAAKPKFAMTVSKGREGVFTLKGDNTVTGWILGDNTLAAGSTSAIALNFSTNKAYVLPSELTANITSSLSSKDTLILDDISPSQATASQKDINIILVDAAALRSERLERYPLLNERGAKPPAQTSAQLVITPQKPSALDNASAPGSLIVTGRPFLSAAAGGQIDQAKRLAASGANINETDPATGYNALMASLKAGNFNMAAELIAMGVNPLHVNRYGQTALHIAAEEGSDESAGALLSKGVDVNGTDHYGNTPLMYAAVSANPKITEIFLSKGARVNAKNRDNSTALNFAALYGNTKNAEILMDAGADINASDRNGSVLASAINQNNKYIVNKLLAAGVDVNKRDSLGRNALHMAALSGNAPFVSELLSHGADINAQDSRGATPLMMATASGNVPVTQSLIAQNPNLYLTDKDGNTAYSLSRGNPQISALLIRSIRSGDEQTAALFQKVTDDDISGVELLIKNKARLNESDIETGNTALFAAVANNHRQMTELLIKSGADVNRQNKLGNTPLIVAVSTGDLKMVSTLLESGANPNTQNNNGDTSLIWAVKLNRAPVVSLLLAAKANPNLKNYDGVTPLSIALGESMDEIEKMLRAFGGF